MRAPSTHAADIDVDPPEPPDPDEELPPDDATHGASVPSPVRQNMEPAMFFAMSAPHRSRRLAPSTAAPSPDTPPPARLLDLPTALLEHVLSRCDSPLDIARFAAVSLLFHGSLAKESIRLWAQERGFELPALPEGESCAVRWLCYSALLRESNPPARAAAGEYHSLFIDGEGRLSSCGSEDGSPWLLGHGEGVTQLNTPTRLPSTLSGERVVSVSAGAFHSLALTTGGAVWSWGYGGYGRLGHGDQQNQPLPKKVEALAGQRVLAVSARGYHSLALTADGAVWSWGFGLFCQLGHGDEQDQLLPKKVEAFAGQHVVAMSAGGDYSLAITADGAVWSWGYGYQGRLGHGNEQNQLLPEKVEAFAGQRVIAVSAANHSLALTADGAAWSWGDGVFGKLGHGDQQDRLLPKKVEAFAAQRVIAVSAGSSHSLATTADGTVLSWGDGYSGRLGHGDEQRQLLPKKVEAFAGRRVVAVSAGNHSLARTADAVFAWGHGGTGQLGHGEDLSDQLLPKKIEARAGAVRQDLDSGAHRTRAADVHRARDGQHPPS